MADRHLRRDLDEPCCIDCGCEADMWCDGHWICDECDDERQFNESLFDDLGAGMLDG